MAEERANCYSFIVVHLTINLIDLPFASQIELNAEKSLIASQLLENSGRLPQFAIYAFI